MSFAERTARELVVFDVEAALAMTRSVVDVYARAADGIAFSVLDGNRARAFARQCGVCTLPAIVGMVNGRAILVMHGPVGRREIGIAAVQLLEFN